jgi:hypothetical protein
MHAEIAVELTRRMDVPFTMGLPASDQPTEPVKCGWTPLAATPSRVARSGPSQQLVEAALRAVSAVR